LRPEAEHNVTLYYCTQENTGPKPTATLFQNSLGETTLMLAARSLGNKDITQHAATPSTVATRGKTHA
jgi:hypothetical protein